VFISIVAVPDSIILVPSLTSLYLFDNWNLTGAIYKTKKITNTIKYRKLNRDGGQFTSKNPTTFIQLTFSVLRH